MPVTLSLFGYSIPTIQLAIAVLAVLLGFAIAPFAARWARARVDDGPAGALIAGVTRRVIEATGVFVALERLGIVSASQVFGSVSAAMDTHLLHLGASDVTIGTLVLVLGSLVAALFVSGRVQAWIARSVRAQGAELEGSVAVASRLVHYVVVFAGVGVGLQTAGVDLTSMFTAGAVFAIGIGFAVQNLTQNFVSGVLLLVEGAIRPGDVLRVDGQLVRVSQMNLRATVVPNLDEAEVIVPNSTLVSARWST